MVGLGCGWINGQALQFPQEGNLDPFGAVPFLILVGVAPFHIPELISTARMDCDWPPAQWAGLLCTCCLFLSQAMECAGAGCSGVRGERLTTTDLALIEGRRQKERKYMQVHVCFLSLRELGEQ